jgi:hypothetical protein
MGFVRVAPVWRFFWNLWGILIHISGENRGLGTGRACRLAKPGKKGIIAGTAFCGGKRMIYISSRLIPFLVPFIITIPLYIAGKKTLFKNVPQAQMHLHTSGKIFTGVICLLHLSLTVFLALLLFFPELWAA